MTVDLTKLVNSISASFARDLGLRTNLAGTCRWCGRTINVFRSGGWGDAFCTDKCAVRFADVLVTVEVLLISYDHSKAKAKIQEDIQHLENHLVDGDFSSEMHGHWEKKQAEEKLKVFKNILSQLKPEE